MAGGASAGTYTRVEDPVEGQVIANWNTGVATSGNAGADLVTISAADIRRLIHQLIVSIRNLTAGATITIRLYNLVNNVEDEVYNMDFIQGTDPDGCWVVNGPSAVHEAVRVEVQSNNALDDGLAIPYSYMTERV